MSNLEKTIYLAYLFAEEVDVPTKCTASEVAIDLK